MVDHKDKIPAPVKGWVVKRLHWLSSLDIPKIVVGFVNSIPLYFFLLLVLLLFFFRFQLHTDEDHYMVLAKQFYAPDWIPNSFTFNEPADTRILYQYIAGFMLEYLSFEKASALGVSLLCIGMAFPLAKIYGHFQFSNVDILLHLPFLYLSRQSFIGQEFIFLAFEPKGIAYFFLFFAVYYMLAGRYRLAVFFSAASTYFHVLVGGWFMLYFLLYTLLAERSLKRSFGLGVLYVFCVAPFLIYLYPTISSNLRSVETPVNLDWIFTYFLQPFHTALFKNMAYFQKGFLISLALFSLCLFVFPKFKDEKNFRLNRINILLFSGTTLALALSYFDRTGSFVKYFPFRINALFAFLLYMQLIYVFRQYFLKKDLAHYFEYGVLALFLLVPFTRAIRNMVFYDIKAFVTNTLVDPAYDDVKDYVRKNTDQEDVFLLLPQVAEPDNYYSYDMTNDFVRRMERDRLVIFVSAPINPGTKKLYQWYQRINAKRSVVEDYRQVCQIKEQYRINYLLTDYALEDAPCYDLCYQNDQYFLYRIRE